jgi:hypothetical protein
LAGGTKSKAGVGFIAAENLLSSLLLYVIPPGIDFGGKKIRINYLAQVFVGFQPKSNIYI